MKLKIHFFRNRKSSLNINRIYEFFGSDRFRYSQAEEYVRFKYINTSLNNNATFVFVKHNVIKDIYELSSAYTNLNLYCEFPLLISNYFLNEILEIVEYFVHKFGLLYYMELNNDITLFSRKDAYDKILKYRNTLYTFDDMTHIRGRVLVPSSKLHEICIYQNNTQALQLYFKDNVDVNSYIVLKNITTERAEFSVVWKEGRPNLFPKHIDYVHLYLKGSEAPLIVPVHLVLNHIHRFLAELPSYISKTKILKPGAPTKKASKMFSKLETFAVDNNNFEELSLNYVIEGDPEYEN